MRLFARGKVLEYGTTQRWTSPQTGCHGLLSCKRTPCHCEHVDRTSRPNHLFCVSEAWPFPSTVRAAAISISLFLHATSGQSAVELSALRVFCGLCTGEVRRESMASVRARFMSTALLGRNEQRAVEPSYRHKDVDVRSADARFVKVKPKCVCQHASVLRVCLRGRCLMCRLEGSSARLYSNAQTDEECTPVRFPRSFCNRLDGAQFGCTQH